MGVAMGASGAPGDTQIKGPQVSSRILSSYGKAEELAFANGNNEQVAGAGPHAHRARKGLSYKTGEPLENGKEIQVKSQ